MKQAKDWCIGSIYVPFQLRFIGFKCIEKHICQYTANKIHIFKTFAFYVIFISNVWVIRNNRLHIDDNMHQPSSPIYSKANMTKITFPDTSLSREQPATLESILNIEQGFCAFMNHVASVKSFPKIFVITLRTKSVLLSVCNVLIC